MEMRPLTLQKIAEIMDGTFFGPPAKLDTPVTAVVRDHRDVIPGSLFFCFPGERVDGHDLAPDAFAAGALCAVSERVLEVADESYILVPSTSLALKQLAKYYRSLFSIPVVGVTGSVGKTTTKEMIASVLGKRYTILKTQGNLNNEIGVPLTLLSLREHHEIAIVEMGISEFGEMHRLAEMVRPDICVITAIGRSHLEYLGDLQGVLRAKSEIFEFMSPDALAILNGDDEYLSSLRLSMRKTTFGFRKENDFYADQETFSGKDEMSFRIWSPNGCVHACVHSFGKHLIAASLAASAVGHSLGLTQDEILSGLCDYAPVGGRSNICETEYITIIDDCYNANPDSVAVGLQSLATLPGRHVAILGDMKELGEHEEDFHREIGLTAAKSGLHCLICCGKAAEYIYAGGLSDTGMEVWYFPEKEELFAALPSLIRKDDTVLVKASHSMRFEEIVSELKCLGIES